MNIPGRSAPRLGTLTGGQTFLFGSAIVIASFGGFYLNLIRIQNNKKKEGRLPHYEYLIANAGPSKPLAGAVELPVSPSEGLINRLPSPVKEHHGKHITIPNFKLSAAAAANGENPKLNSRAQYEQPTPQRPKAAGSSLVYTKSPDYVKSYEKVLVAKPKNTSEPVEGSTKEKGSADSGGRRRT